MERGSFSGITVRTTATNFTIAVRTGVYEGCKVTTTRTVYFDNQRVGSSYDAVDPSK